MDGEREKTNVNNFHQASSRLSRLFCWPMCLKPLENDSGKIISDQAKELAYFGKTNPTPEKKSFFCWNLSFFLLEHILSPQKSKKMFLSDFWFWSLFDAQMALGPPLENKEIEGEKTLKNPWKEP